MDLKNIESYQEVTGFTLNPEEICALNASMQQRRIDENLNGLIQFFGKFFGIEQDYLIVVNINTDTAFPTKKFYCWLVK